MREENELADELAESFYNGNRTHVCDELAAMHPLRAALMAAMIHRRLGKNGNDWIAALAARAPLE